MPVAVLPVAKPTHPSPTPTAEPAQALPDRVPRHHPMAMTVGATAALSLAAWLLGHWGAVLGPGGSLLALPAATGGGALLGQWLAERIDWDEVFPLC